MSVCKGGKKTEVEGGKEGEGEREKEGGREGENIYAENDN